MRRGRGRENAWKCRSKMENILHSHTTGEHSVRPKRDQDAVEEASDGHRKGPAGVKPKAQVGGEKGETPGERWI